MRGLINIICKECKHFTLSEVCYIIISCIDLVVVNVDPTRRYLYLQVLGGRAFLDHLQETPSLPGQITSIFTLHLNFRGQRFRSRPTPCACEPDLQEAFLLELHKDITGTLFIERKVYFNFILDTIAEVINVLLFIVKYCHRSY